MAQIRTSIILNHVIEITGRSEGSGRTRGFTPQYATWHKCLFLIQEFPKGPQITVAGFLFTCMALVKNKIVFSQWVIVNPETVLCFPAHDRYHDGHRERPEGVSGNRFESVAPSGPHQRCYPQARPAPRQRTELSDELGGAQSGNAAHLHHWPAAAGVR